LNTYGSIIVPLKTLEKYGVKAGDQLLSVRGSCFALAFCVKGPIIEEAKKPSKLNPFHVTCEQTARVCEILRLEKRASTALTEKKLIFSRRRLRK
jgi:hypothetical protein